MTEQLDIEEMVLAQLQHEQDELEKDAAYEKWLEELEQAVGLEENIGDC